MKVTGTLNITDASSGSIAYASHGGMLFDSIQIISLFQETLLFQAYVFSGTNYYMIHNFYIKEVAGVD